MPKQAVQFRSRPRRKVETTSLLAVDGINQRDLAQLLDASKAQLISNYLIDASGQLIKRKGLKKESEISSITGYSLLKHFYNNVFVVGYGTTISLLDISTDVETVLKNDFGAGDFSGVRYGNYFFVCNGTTKVQRISNTLLYDTQTANFTEGLVITGGTSGATATILTDVDGGAAGTLTIGNITGVFQDGEIITDSSTGSASVNGTLTPAITEISAAPKAKVLYSFISPSSTDAGARLFAGNIVDDSASSNSTLIFSNVDTGANPPFDTWTQSSASNTGGKFVGFRDSGSVTTISSIGSQVIVGYEGGRAGFRITTIDSAGTIVKLTEPDFQNIEEGMSSGSIKTNKGLFFTNQSGLFSMFSGGTTNSFDEQTSPISLGLGDAYFDDMTFPSADTIYDVKRNLILFTMARDSGTNNLVLAYNIDTKSIVELPMNISRWTKIGNVIYGASSINGKIYQVFEGDTDDGFSIPTDFQQELQIGALDKLSDLDNFVIQAILSQDETIDIRFNIYDRNGNQINDAKILQMTGQTTGSLVKSWGSASYGSSSWGSGIGGSGIASRPYQLDSFIPEFWRLSIRLTSSNKTQHAINFFTARVTDRDESLILNNLTEI